MSEPVSSESNGYDPRIVAFFCNWCTYTASDLAGTSRMDYAPNTRVVRLMCSGRLDPQFVLAAFRQGADGVLIGGCHPGDCHYLEGNYKCLRRVELLRQMLGQFGIEPERLRLEWISASEGDKVRDVTNEMVQQLRRLGPLKMEPVPVHKVAGMTTAVEEGTPTCPSPKSDSIGAHPAEDARKPLSTSQKVSST
ncbi:MAG: hydrogenase iron-sulfur subunit [Sedimentisphaerales bacterium]|nr:hydrogenase iron-sulfur subunit [Sedimentisphaerales bacterium]